MWGWFVPALCVWAVFKIAQRARQEYLRRQRPDISEALRRARQRNLERRALDAALGESNVSNMKRAVGYCENMGCPDLAKGVFLLNHGRTFSCPTCHVSGIVEEEKGFYTGTSDIYKECRVEFDFDSRLKVYRQIAVVRDESLPPGCNVYTLHSPLIKTERRALKVAEAILANLNRFRGLLGQGDIPKSTEFILSFDDDLQTFCSKVQVLEEELKKSNLIYFDRKRLLIRDISKLI